MLPVVLTVGWLSAVIDFISDPRQALRDSLAAHCACAAAPATAAAMASAAAAPGGGGAVSRRVTPEADEQDDPGAASGGGDDMAGREPPPLHPASLFPDTLDGYVTQARRFGLAKLQACCCFWVHSHSPVA